MKKFTLYDEYNKISLYGLNLADAVTRAGELPRPSKFVAGEVIPAEPVIVNRVIGYEDMTNTTRGNDRFIRLIIETIDGKIVGVDAKETGTIAMIEEVEA